MGDATLAALCKSPARPIVTIRTNAAPTLWALWQATPEHLAPFEENEVLQRVNQLREDKALVERLCRAAYAAERVYERSQNVEEQLYGYGFPSAEDEALMRAFHASSLPDRVALLRGFADIADALKHAILTRRLPREVEEAGQVLTTGRGYGTGPFGEGNYGGVDEVWVLSRSGPRPLRAVISSVANVWKLALAV